MSGWLFVDGPWDGLVRDVPLDRHVIIVPVLREEPWTALWDASPISDVYAEVVYHREKFMLGPDGPVLEAMVMGTSGAMHVEATLNAITGMSRWLG